jgi:hypothetical protein
MQEREAGYDFFLSKLNKLAIVSRVEVEHSATQGLISNEIGTTPVLSAA